ncbi:MAG: SDR family NAD(P)-dependent oxidoreductase [Flavobacteriales bacterium]
MVADKTYALVTGASSGIGKEMAILLAKEGRDVIITARNSAALEELRAKIGGFCAMTVIPITCDLGVPGGADALIKALEEGGYKVCTLINNAGFGDYGAFADADRAKTVSMLDLNVRALTELTHHFLPKMIERRHGRILNVASVAAFVPGPLMSVYYATKHYVLAFTEGLARELKGTGVTVTALCPGPTSSGFQEAAALGEVEFFNDRHLPTSKEVAKYGLEALRAKKVIAVHGVSNKVMTLLPRLLPRSVVRNLVYRIQKK